jgi:hypothetical protein
MHIEVLTTPETSSVQQDASPATVHVSSDMLEWLFSHKADRNAEDAVQHNLAWLRRYRLLPGDASAQTRLAEEAVRQAMALYPSAEDESLSLAVDAVAWLTCWINEYHHLRSTNDKLLTDLTWQLVDVTLHRAGIEPAGDVHPLTWSFLNLWKREAAGMSLRWQERAAMAWRTLFLSLPGETDACQPQHERQPSVWSALGHGTGGTLFGDLIEGCLKFELPRAAHESAEIHGMLGIADRSLQLKEDPASASFIDPAQEAQALMLRWRDIYGRLSGLYHTLRLGADQQACVERYVFAIASLARCRPA